MVETEALVAVAAQVAMLLPFRLQLILQLLSLQVLWLWLMLLPLMFLLFLLFLLWLLLLLLLMSRWLSPLLLWDLLMRRPLPRREVARDLS
ncbi:MAG: hypothetical protein ACKPKO_17035 [Candidatus Fonsibacter sp.]